MRAGRWADSAKMMAAARAAEDVEGVERALCFMGTPANREEATGLGVADAAIEGRGPTTSSSRSGGRARPRGSRRPRRCSTGPAGCGRRRGRAPGRRAPWRGSGATSR